jgi:hypothetical protein
MSIWMLNLGFSTTGNGLTNGSFEPPPSNPGGNLFLCSQSWLKYAGATTPSWAVDGIHLLPGGSISPGDWTYQSDSDAGPLSAVFGDFMVVRFFPVGAYTPSDRLKTTLVFGRGIWAAPPSNRFSRQSPLQQLVSPNMPLSIIDRANDPSTWDYPQDSVVCWSWCLGVFHSDPIVGGGGKAHYGFNIGASYASATNLSVVYMYGHDPKIIVTNPGGPLPG